MGKGIFKGLFFCFDLLFDPQKVNWHIKADIVFDDICVYRKFFVEIF